MFGLFTKNFDTMTGATGNKKKLGELSDINEIRKEELGYFLGGEKNKHYDGDGGGKRKRSLLEVIFGT